MYLGLRKIILLIIVFSFCSLSLLGKEKNMNFAIGVETRNFIMTGITTEFNYERFKVGGYFSYWHNHQSEKALSAEAFLVIVLNLKSELNEERLKKIMEIAKDKGVTIEFIEFNEIGYTIE